ncbi:MAG: DEAD/DEAH box helicase [Tildeniella nuda ZEHNDER 1965/U140]|nr:DEAD/DEAH box helicase [Tildeniella nuda ZEHNDER 1965/U140]
MRQPEVGMLEGGTQQVWLMARKYRFSWDAFGEGTVKAIAHANGYSSHLESDPRTWLTNKYSRPDEYFVERMKSTLEQCWLPDYEGTPQLVEQLIDAGIGPLGNPKTPMDCVAYVRKCRNSKTVRLRLLEAMLRYGDQDRQPDDPLLFPTDGSVPRFAILDPTKQPVDCRQPYDYQIEAWDKLSVHFAESEVTKVFQGLLVMPTGSGKTFTSARWLMQNVINRGYRLIWLAHRHELLEQAAREFHNLASFATQLEKVRVRIISGIHCSTTQIDPADHILIASVSSLARRPDLIDQILADPKSFLVIDEAHHSTAKSYQALINRLGTIDRRRILGITATPTRTAETERGTLAKLFGNRILHDVPITTLIERQFLARPLPVRVATEADVEAGVTSQDEQFLAQFHDLSEAWLQRIGHLEERNRLIVDHYLQNHEKYGKTLIFAIDVSHAALLTERLQAKGIKADYVASYRLDGEPTNNQERMHRFRDKDGEDAIEVLVNVQILTEGVDIPGIQTVFLTRPTVSEILMRQMIGRALRGEKAGGTKDAYIVSFEDHWERFREWQRPLALVPDIVPPEPDAEKSTKVVPPTLVSMLPWDLIRAAAAQVATQGRGFEADVFEAIPHGWYLLSRDQDGEDVYQVIAVYEHQHSSWEALLKYLWTLPQAALETMPADTAFDEFFWDSDYPLPSQHDVQKVIAHRLAGGDYPEYNDLAEREACDPYRLANQIFEADLGAKAQNTLTEDRYTALAQAIYPSLRDFRAAIEDALYERQHPDASTRAQRAVPIFHPRPEETLQPGPHHNLDHLMIKVLELASGLLGIDQPLTQRHSVVWTKRLVKGWYGQAYWEPGQPHGQGKIRLNRLLDSPDVSEDVIQYLLWHEYLHLYLQQGHTQTFREYERRWATYQECDRFLDNLNERFGVQFW